MAIESGQAIVCADLQSVGGTRTILIREWKADDIIGYTKNISSIYKIRDVGDVTATWGVYESKIESSSLTVNATNEGKDTTTVETTLSFNLPYLERTKIVRLNEFEGKCLMVLVIDNNDDGSNNSNLVMGISDKYRSTYRVTDGQTYARLASVIVGGKARKVDKKIWLEHKV